MKSNVGNLDRVLRLGAALALVIVLGMGLVQGVPAIVTGVVAAVLTLTGLMGFCPAYRLVGLSTCGRR